MQPRSLSIANLVSLEDNQIMKKLSEMTVKDIKDQAMKIRKVWETLPSNVAIIPKPAVEELQQIREKIIKTIPRDHWLRAVVEHELEDNQLTKMSPQDVLDIYQLFTAELQEHGVAAHSRLRSAGRRKDSGKKFMSAALRILAQDEKSLGKQFEYGIAFNEQYRDLVAAHLVEELKIGLNEADFALESFLAHKAGGMSFDKDLWKRANQEAENKFDRFPSPVATAWAKRWYSKRTVL